MDLEALRIEIDQLDREIRDLLVRRMDCARAVGAYKRQRGLPIFQPDREEQVLEKNLLEVGEDYRLAYGQILRKIMETSRSLQGELQEGQPSPDAQLDIEGILEAGSDAVPPTTVAFQGIEGSYSEEALVSLTGGRTVQKKPYETFREAVDSVLNGTCEAVVLPIENSSTGGVGEAENLLADSGLYITAEWYLPIDHVLLGLPEAREEQLRLVVSHPQGLQQCSRYLQQAGLIGQPWYNTAISARKVAEDADPTQGAIASRRAGSIYGLKVLREQIADNGHNYTRFVLASRKPQIQDGCNKIGLRLSTAHEVGALYRIIGIIAQSSLNMARIESRPIHGRPWEYYFFIDVEGNLKEKRVRKALETIGENSSHLTFLGNYPKGEWSVE